eukprot:CAMPEP_0119268964 /NCGR_PEP_ID=MMETSP1329-20130426/6554_1 /TAXON_ID=114041 /ORGANISM="Genus nov. species nov., Strain RCC1024" /LENGTH=129 /DNA_ID=CAMNT_0007268949 /DNA_START=98 /DNA_END=484 /DNA_ORIENTATION=+
MARCRAIILLLSTVTCLFPSRRKAPRSPRSSAQGGPTEGLFRAAPRLSNRDARAAVAALTTELESLKTEQRRLREDNKELKRLLAEARRNCTELRNDLARDERLKERMRGEVNQLRDVAKNATYRAGRA